MAQTIIRNPVVLSARRGRTATTIHLTDQDGSTIDLVFTSFKALANASMNLAQANVAMQDGDTGACWFSRSSAARAHRRAKRSVWGVLQRLGLLDPPYRPL